MPVDLTHAERTREGIQRARQRRRLRITHAERYPAEVAEPLKVIVQSRAAELVQLVEDLGGERELSAAQLALARQWAQVSVVREVAFSVWLAEGAPLGGRAIDKLLAASNTETRTLVALGLERRAREPESLASYLARRAAQDASTGIADRQDHDQGQEGIARPGALQEANAEDL